jgi:hypothetical protein
VNGPVLIVLAAVAVAQSRAGCDLAPSDLVLIAQVSPGPSRADRSRSSNVRNRGQNVPNRGPRFVRSPAPTSAGRKLALKPGSRRVQSHGPSHGPNRALNDLSLGGLVEIEADDRIQVAQAVPSHPLHLVKKAGVRGKTATSRFKCD